MDENNNFNNDFVEENEFVMLSDTEKEENIENVSQAQSHSRSPSTTISHDNDTTDLAHPVWQFFEISRDTREYFCLLCRKEGKKTKPFTYTENQGPSTTVAKRHVLNPTFHAKELSMIKEKLAEAKKKTPKRKRQHEIDPSNSNLKQSKLDVIKPKYAKENPKQKRILDKLALLASTPSFPTHQLVSKRFLDFCSELNEQADLPFSRHGINTLVNKKKDIVLAAIKQKIATFEFKPAVILDIWSDPQMHESYLGVSLQVLFGTELRKIFLELRPLEEKHSAEVIRSELFSILEAFNLNSQNISRFCSDNASNMIKALVHLENYPEINEEEEADEYCYLPDGFEQEEEEDNEFEPEISLPQRFSCIVHTLNLVVKDAIKEFLEKDPCFEQLKKVITHFHHSHQSTRELFIISGKRVLSLCPTRWSYWFFSISRFIKIYEDIKKVYQKAQSERRKLPELPDSSAIKFLKNFVEILEPIITDLIIPLHSENKPTLPLVYTGIKEVLSTLEEIQNKNADVRVQNLGKKMIKNIRSRFAFAIDKLHPKFDFYFLLSSYFDPVQCFILDEGDLATAKEYITTMVKNIKTPSTEQSDSPSSSNNIIQRRIKQKIKSKNVGSEKAALDKQLSTAFDYYNDFVDSNNGAAINALEFWLNCREMLRIFRALALEILTIPASSASQERIFSFAGIMTNGRRNRTGPNTLNEKLFVSLNEWALR